ncbi:unnamed protein product [Tilletia controversa]|nr:unnamed protein product [Tilletia controversa]
MSLISPAYVFDGAPPSSSNARTPDEVLQRVYASTLWLGESHTPMLVFLATFLAPDRLGPSAFLCQQRVRIKEDEATVRSSVTYTKQLKPVFALLRTAEELRNRHQPRPVVRQETASGSTSSAVEIAAADNANGLSEVDREILATLCSSSHPCYNPPLDRRRQHHAREIQLQIVLVLFLLDYMTRHPPPSGVSAFLPILAPPPMMRPYGMMMGGRSASLPSMNGAASVAKQDVLSLNKRFEALVEQLSVLQLRAVVPELQLGNHAADALSKVQPLYARPEVDPTTAAAAEVTPSKLQMHVPAAPVPKLFKLENLMASFYTPILEPLFADSLPQQLAQFQDRCGDIDVTDTVWASDPESSPVINRTTAPSVAFDPVPPEPQLRDDDEETQAPPPPKPLSTKAVTNNSKKARNIPLGTPDLAPEKKARKKHPPLLTKMIGGGREISMDSRSFTRSSSAGPGQLMLGESQQQGQQGGGGGGGQSGPVMMSTTTTTTTTVTMTAVDPMGPPLPPFVGQSEEGASPMEANHQDALSVPASASASRSQSPSMALSQLPTLGPPARENPFKVGPFSSAAKRKFPFSSAAAGGGLKRFNTVDAAVLAAVKKEREES